MRVLFMGTPRAAVPTLRAIHASDHELVGVACQPDRPAHRGRVLTPPPVKEEALALGLPVLQPDSLRPAGARAAIAALEPDVLVVVAYGRILGPKLLAVPPHGAVNLHFSLLPRWRGAAPVQRALLAGDGVTGVSIIRLVPELDAGPVLARAELAIEPREHAPSLESRLAAAGAALLVETLDALASGLARDEPQDEAAVTWAPPLSKDEGALDPARPAAELEARVRALDPWPGTRLLGRAGLLGVLEATALGSGATPAAAAPEAAEAAPGTVLPPSGEDVPVACGEGVLLLRRVKPEGRAAMTARAAVNGRYLVVGEVLARPPASPGVAHEA